MAGRTARGAVTATVAFAAILSGVTGLQNAEAVGDTRSLTIHHTHSGEDITVTFKRQGRYDEDGLRRLNHFLRDWRTQDVTTMDRRLFDIIWEVYREVDGKEPIQIISAYRSPHTNAMLRRRSSGVARNSQHMQGHAMDFYIPGVPLSEIRNAGLRLQRGGVGFYPTSGSPFVHLDTGSVRHWPRMTHDQLARVFPDGKTVHIPTDGQPLQRYAVALAELGRRGDQPSALSLASARRGGATSDEDGETTAPARFFAKLLGRAPKPDPQSEPADADAPARAEPAAAPEIRTASIAQSVAPSVPLPRNRPAASYQLAALPADKAAAEPKPATANPAANTANDVIRNRGFWEAAAFGDIPTASTARRPRGEARAAEAVAAVSRAAGESDAEPAQAMGYAALPRGSRDSVADAARQLAASAALRAAAMSAPRPAGNAARPEPVRTAALAPVGKLADAARDVASKVISGPWLRTIIVTPSVRHYLQTAVFHIGDYRSLTPFLHKPQSTVAMAFTAEPNPGLHSEKFAGSAVSFINSVTFIASTRTASLR